VLPLLAIACGDDLINFSILVDLDLVGAGSCCLGEENKLTWYDREITVAFACTGIPWMGLFGMMAINA
jgi:hypothetical protein